MTLFRERRSYAVPPPRRGRRPTLDQVLRHEAAQPEPPTEADVLESLPARARRVVLDDYRNRDGRR